PDIARVGLARRVRDALRAAPPGVAGRAPRAGGPGARPRGTGGRGIGRPGPRCRGAGGPGPGEARRGLTRPREPGGPGGRDAALLAKLRLKPTSNGPDG